MCQIFVTDAFTNKVLIYYHCLSPDFELYVCIRFLPPHVSRFTASKMRRAFRNNKANFSASKQAEETNQTLYLLNADKGNLFGFVQDQYLAGFYIRRLDMLRPITTVWLLTWSAAFSFLFIPGLGKDDRKSIG